MTSLYTTFASSLLFPLHERLKGHTSVAVRRGLEVTQWWQADKLRALQLERLRALLIDVGRNVPYYHGLFRDQGFDPTSVSSLSDLERLPFLTKPLIRAHTAQLKHAEAQGLTRFNTGGSSGEPLIFFIGNERVSHDVAAKWRATRWWGVDIGDPEIVVWGSPIELGAQDRARRARDYLLRSSLLPAFEMNESKLDSMVMEIQRRRPRMIFGYPSALSHIARHATLRGQRMDDLGVRAVFVTSERLYDEQRKTIVDAFGCPVANGYGGRDAGFIAHECPEGGLHITAEDIIVEIVDGEGCTLPPGQAGEVVITHLATRDFPFVRYRTGDVAILEGECCVCGRGLPMLREIQGRTTDFVVASDGTVMHGLALIYILRDLPAVQSFKVVQESISLTRVILICARPLSQSIRETIETGFKRRLGMGVTVEIEEVERIEPEQSGKFRYVVSHVSVPDGSTLHQQRAL